MKFVTNDGTIFEVSNLTHIVINNVTQIIELGEAHSDKRKNKPPRLTNKKVRDNGDKGTRLWIKTRFKKGIRWLKYRHLDCDQMSLTMGHDYSTAEAFDSSENLQKTIQECMMQGDKRVWFSGTYCNIEICENYQEVQRIKAQEASRKSRARATKILKSPHLDEILRKAISSAGAQVRQESISTPFGQIPVMTIAGSGDLLRDMERIEKTGQLVSLDEAAKQLKIRRR